MQSLNRTLKKRLKEGANINVSAKSGNVPASYLRLKITEAVCLFVMLPMSVKIDNSSIDRIRSY